MKLFQNLFKPKWKNNDPVIRKQAILSLAPADSQEAFVEIVADDPNTDLRLLALKRLSDFDFIVKASQSNTDTRVKDLANKRVKQTLSGEQTSIFDEPQRIEKIQQINEQKLFEYIIEKGNTVTLRKSVIEHISREALLGDLAISDTDSSIRYTAAQKISQKSTLERVYRATKTKDKHISRIVKAQLEFLIVEAEKPAKLLAAQKVICAAIEGLGSKGLWQRDKLQFDRYIQQWLALEEPTSLALKNRLAQACIQFTNHYEGYLKRQEERLAEEATYLPIKEEKQAIIEELTWLIDRLEKLPDTETLALFDIQQSIAEKESAFNAIKTLPEDIEEEIGLQFREALQSIKHQVNQRLHNKTLLDKLDNLHKDINDHLKRPFKLSASVIHRFESTWADLVVPVEDEPLAKLKQKMKQKISLAGELLEKQAERMESLFGNIKVQMDEMEAQLSDGILKEAIGMRNTLQNNLMELEKHGAKNLQTFKDRLNRTSQQINELSSWRSWANTPQKEQLIKKIEALIGSDLDPKEIAYLVSQARKDWKNLGPSEKNSSQVLWEKFQVTCDKAYEPCKDFFSNEAKNLEKNAQERIVFLESLEHFLGQADWENIDWKKVETLFRQTRQDWNELGLTDRKKRKELNKRFYVSHNQLKRALNREWNKNEKKKMTIIHDAEALINEENLQTAINEAKVLQQQWKSAGRIQHAKESALWAQFKQASDAVFVRRERLNKQKDREAQQHIDEKNALIEKIETCCGQPLEKFNDAKGELQQLQHDLKSLGQTSSEADVKFNQRLTTALNLYERKQASLAKYNVIADLMRLKEKSAICHKLECAIEINESICAEGITKEMESIAAPKKMDWKKKISQRFQKSLLLAQAGDSSVLYGENTKKNLELKKRSVVQLEIIADIETPKEAMDERMKAQTQRLADKLQNHEAEDEWDSFLTAEVNWLTVGPILNDDFLSLNVRHDVVIRALKLTYPEELKNY